MKPNHAPPPSSLSNLLHFIHQLKTSEVASGNRSDFIFRGQRNDYPLIPRLARLTPKGHVLNIEKLMMAEFERQHLPFTEFEPKTDWDILALAQHHGLPTRLLDWTYSPLAALWFCVRKAPSLTANGAPMNGVLWILKTTKKDFINFKTGPSEESPYHPGKTRIFRPRIITRRIMAQTALFTCHKRTQGGTFVRLESNASYKDRLIKIPIPGNLFATLRESLMASGVSSLSLFPDLDGLAAHLERLYFHNATPSL